MSDWYERAEQELCDALNNCEITEAEFNREMRALADELRGMAEEAAEGAYNDVMGGW